MGTKFACAQNLHGQVLHLAVTSQYYIPAAFTRLLIQMWTSSCSIFSETSNFRDMTILNKVEGNDFVFPKMSLPSLCDFCEPQERALLFVTPSPLVPGPNNIYVLPQLDLFVRPSITLRFLHQLQTLITLSIFIKKCSPRWQIKGIPI